MIPVRKHIGIKDRMTFRPRGIWPMLYAFFDDADALDRPAMRRQVEACVREVDLEGGRIVVSPGFVDHG